MSPEKEARDSDALAIEKERQKTKRYALFIFTLLTISVIGIFVVFKGSESGGKRQFDLNIKEGKISFSVDKPIVEQVKLSTAKYETPEGSVQFTTSKVDASVLDQITKNESVSSKEFLGKNFINREAGFLLTVENPSHWQVTYNPDGMTNSFLPVNTIYTKDGSHFNANVGPSGGLDLESYVDASLQVLIQSGALTQMPRVEYDHESGTAFLFYVNLLTGGRTYQKVVLKGESVYVATANYNQSITDPERIKDLIGMVASFSVIGT